MTNKIQSWKNADKASCENNPVSNVTIDSDIMSRIVGGQQAGACSEDHRDPNLEAILKALSMLKYL